MTERCIGIEDLPVGARVLWELSWHGSRLTGTVTHHIMYAGAPALRIDGRHVAYPSSVLERLPDEELCS